MEYSSDPIWTGGRSDGRIAIVVSQFNDYITEGLLMAARETLVSAGLPEDRLDVIRVPGALELPLAGLSWIETHSEASEAVLALGCVIKGDTTHFDIVVEQSCRQLADISMATGVPVLNGVLACENMDQAIARSGKDDHNKGIECARAALKIINILDQLDS